MPGIRVRPTAPVHGISILAKNIPTGRVENTSIEDAYRMIWRIIRRLQMNNHRIRIIQQKDIPVGHETFHQVTSQGTIDVLDKSIPQIFVDDSWGVVGKQFIRLLRSHLPEDGVDQAPHDAIVNFALIVVVEPTFVPDWNRRIIVTGGSNRNWNETQFFGRLLSFVFFAFACNLVSATLQTWAKKVSSKLSSTHVVGKETYLPFEVQATSVELDRFCPETNLPLDR